MNNEEIEFVVTKEEGGKRLDVVVRAHLGDQVSRAAARKLCSQGDVLVHGRPAVPGILLVRGDTVRVLRGVPAVSARAELVPDSLPEPEVLFKDDSLIVLAKPRAIHCVTQRPDDPPTPADWLATYYPECRTASEDPREAGLVQRLDFYTSGAILAARSPAVWQALHFALTTGAVQKTYLALVEGSPRRDSWRIDSPLYSIDGGKRMAIANEATKKPISKMLSAETKLRCLSRHYSQALGMWISLVRASAPSARRHQVRAHLAASGHPLLGDVLYGSALGGFPVQPTATETEQGFFLHAEKLSFLHPLHGDEIEIEAGTEMLATWSSAEPQ